MADFLLPINFTLFQNFSFSSSPSLTLSPPPFFFHPSHPLITNPYIAPTWVSEDLGTGDVRVGRTDSIPALRAHNLEQRRVSRDLATSIVTRTKQKCSVLAGAWTGWLTVSGVVRECSPERSHDTES